jgi:hypothetical protein
MVQAGYGPRFALEALAQVGVGREMLGKALRATVRSSLLSFAR